MRPSRVSGARACDGWSLPEGVGPTPPAARGASCLDAGRIARSALQARHSTCGRTGRSEGAGGARPGDGADCRHADRSRQRVQRRHSFLRPSIWTAKVHSGEATGLPRKETACIVLIIVCPLTRTVFPAACMHMAEIQNAQDLSKVCVHVLRTASAQVRVSIECAVGMVKALRFRFCAFCQNGFFWLCPKAASVKAPMLLFDAANRYPPALQSNLGVSIAP